MFILSSHFTVHHTSCGLFKRGVLTRCKSDQQLRFHWHAYVLQVNTLLVYTVNFCKHIVLAATLNEDACANENIMTSCQNLKAPLTSI